MKLSITVALIIFGNIVNAQSYNGPESVDFDENTGSYFVSNTANSQIIARAANGDLSVFASNIGSGPHGLEVVNNEIYACSGSRLKAFDLTTGEQTVNVNLGASFANGITHKGNDVFVTDFSAKKVFRYNIESGNFNTYIENIPNTPNGIFYDDINDRMLFVCWGSNAPIYEINLIDSSYAVVANTSLGNCDGIAMDNNGDFYVSAWSNNAISKFNSDFSESSEVVVSEMSSPADIYYNRDVDTLAIPNTSNNTVVFVGIGTVAQSWNCIDNDCSEDEDGSGLYNTLEECQKECQAISVLEINVEEMAFYPNPVKANEWITIDTNLENIEILDLSGRLIEQLNLNNANKVRLPNLTKGIYLIRTENKFSKIVIE
jgi:hypothetical protein